MPPLRHIRQDKAVRAFLRLGGVERRSKSSHRLVKMPNGEVLSLPKGTLNIGLLKNLLKTGDITPEEFQKAL